MKKVVLLILDGWGIGNKDKSDAIFNAQTPFIDSLQDKPNSTLKTFGENVGLPKGQMGNSEVGHMNIGAGRVVWQMLVRINKAFQNNEVGEMEQFIKLLSLAKQNPNRKIHLMGLVSDGGVHSNMEHLLMLTELFKEVGMDDRVFVHAFTDGRDTAPNGGKEYLTTVCESSKFGNARLASICGRYYAMDRDKRWARTRLAYDLLVHGKGDRYDDYQTAMQSNYDTGTTDEFIKPISLDASGVIQDDDIVLCFNYRTDRGRQISTVLTQKSMPEEGMSKLNIHYFTMTEYDKTYQGVNVLFDSQDLKNTLGEVLAKNDKKQLRASETEKYPHVTFFFNGGREEPFEGEDRAMANSPKVATYDLQPEMSAQELTDKVIAGIERIPYDFVCINYANPDMVGHTGVFDAIVKACETVDACAERLVKVGEEHGYSFIIIADHGNADKAINEDGTPHTAHTTNLVPCFILDDKVKNVRDGKLADIAPTVLDLLGLAAPDEFDGESLIEFTS
ncbi:MAG: phosphoglycerate mutase (2,3-diphosphoglycerate-independent) [Bacteroidetes bacterium]|nr:MAG: phosphoglycerate mutase (2,3-diphosphoglycerate-independent) [Bacteroidota bacterium]